VTWKYAAITYPHLQLYIECLRGHSSSSINIERVSVEVMPYIHSRGARFKSHPGLFKDVITTALAINVGRVVIINVEVGEM
jgi:hypothetical protein